MSPRWSQVTLGWLSQLALVPIGMISVLLLLNLTPAAVHYLFRTFHNVSMSSVSTRYTVVSSANIVTTNFSASLGILYPSMSLHLHSRLARGSIARLKSRQDRGSPCCTPLDTLKRVLGILAWRNTMTCNIKKTEKFCHACTYARGRQWFSTCKNDIIQTSLIRWC